MGFPLSNLVLSSVVLAAFLSAARSSLVFSPGVNFLGLFLFESFLWASWRVVFYPRFSSPLRGLPQPKNGNNVIMGQFGRIMREYPGAPMEEWISTIPNDGLIYYRGLFNGDRLLLTNPKALTEVLSSRCYEFVKPSQFRSSISRLLGYGLLLVEGDEHKIQRKNLAPAFAFRHIKSLYPIFWEKGCEMIQAMTADLKERQSGVQPSGTVTEGNTDTVSYSKIEISQWTSRAALDIIGVAGLGIEFNSIKDPSAPLAVQYRKVLQPSTQAQLLAVVSMVIPAVIIDRLPLKRNNDIWQAVKVIRETCHHAIQQKKTTYQNTGKFSDNDILTVAIESGGFSDENLVDQLMTFLAAGHETTATSMIWVMYQLAKDPDMQRRLREEIRQHLPSPSAPNSTVDDKLIDSLPYLHAITQETLRFSPAVPITIRVAQEDTTILGHFVPKDTRILLAAQAINRSKALWGEDACEFRPDRWLGEGRSGNGGASSNYANLTFLHGPRSCIGQSFAKAEFKCLLAVLAGRLDVRIADPDWVPEIKGGLTAKPKGGLTVLAKVVEGW